MSRPYGFLLLASIASCLGLAGSGPWASARQRGEVVELGKLKSRVPADWVRVRPGGPSYHRQYRLEAVGDDKDDADLTVELPGKGGGASAGEQVRRWKEMFLPPEGKKLDDVARVRRLKVSGAAVTYLDVRGDYKGIAGDAATPRQNFRLLGVYFDAPQGPYLIRLFGPTDTVEFYRQEFEDWVQAFK